MTKLLTTTAVLVALIAPAISQAIAETPLLKSLPPDAQREIEQVRQACREAGDPSRVTEGDDGLIKFTVSGAQAVLVDQLNFCGHGQDCIHGVNCATGFTHSVAIYVRTGKSWRKALSLYASEPVMLGLDNGTDEFKALVLNVFSGDLGCPVRANVPLSVRSRETCLAVVKWNGTAFVHSLL